MSSDSHSNDPLKNITQPREARPKLDGEQAPLRDSYLQLGGWLEQAAGEFDEATFLAKLRENLADSQPAAAAERAPRWLLSLLAVAATAVLGFVSWWSFAEKVSVIDQPVAKLPTATGVSLPWTDPLDDQLAAAWQQVREGTDSRRNVDPPLQWLHDQIREMEADLQSGSL
jgi:hypothetical protein